jgi:hypothetical protein
MACPPDCAAFVATFRCRRTAVADCREAPWIHGCSQFCEPAAKSSSGCGTPSRPLRFRAGIRVWDGRFWPLPAVSPSSGTSANNSPGGGCAAGAISRQRWPVGDLEARRLNRLPRVLPRGIVRAIAGWADGKAANHAEQNRRSGPSVVKEVGRRTKHYRSSGRRPVCFAIRASIFGPSSSSSWNANTKSGDPGWDKVR